MLVTLDQNLLSRVFKKSMIPKLQKILKSTRDLKAVISASYNSDRFNRDSYKPTPGKCLTQVVTQPHFESYPICYILDP